MRAPRGKSVIWKSSLICTSNQNSVPINSRPGIRDRDRPSKLARPHEIYSSINNVVAQRSKWEWDRILASSTNLQRRGDARPFFSFPPCLSLVPAATANGVIDAKCHTRALRFSFYAVVISTLIILDPQVYCCSSLIRDMWHRCAICYQRLETLQYLINSNFDLPHCHVQDSNFILNFAY